MAEKTLEQTLAEAGLSDEDIAAVAKLAAAARDKAAKTADEALERVRAAGEAHPLLGEALKIVRDLLRGWLAERNLTPGQHPATHQALARLDQLTAPPES